MDKSVNHCMKVPWGLPCGGMCFTIIQAPEVGSNAVPGVLCEPCHAMRRDERDEGDEYWSIQPAGSRSTTRVALQTLEAVGTFPV